MTEIDDESKERGYHIEKEKTAIFMIVLIILLLLMMVFSAGETSRDLGLSVTKLLKTN